MSWDDGAHTKVKKVQITYDEVIYLIKVTYDESNLQSQLRGSIGPKSAEFTLDSDEYVTSLDAYAKTLGSQEAVTYLAFKTNKKTYGPYGNKTNYQISAPDAKGKQIAGFLGSSSNILNEINVHYAPVPASTSGGSGGTGQKLEGIGSDGGTSWDDGAYDGVKKVFVGQADSGISAVKFVYNKGPQVVNGGEHGKPTMLDFEEFEIDYPSEYITAVEGTYDKIFGSDGTVINMLRFKTNKKTSPPFGIEAGTPFEFKKEGHKIVGFHGSVKTLLNKFGVHVLPISK